MIFNFETSAGIRFLYDNDKNCIYDKNTGDPIFVNPVLNNDQNAEFAKINFGTRKKHNKPFALKILMGHACNYSCEYCMQKDIGNPNERPRRKELVDFFDNVNKNLDLSNLKKVELWGGEPFLYWEDMKDLISFFDKEDFTISISTNGSCLHNKHYEFFKTLKSTIIISISHDGPQQLQLRGDEIFTINRVIETLKKFDTLPNVNYGFQCSVTNTNFDLFEINHFFRDKIIKYDLGTWFLSFSLGRTYQETPNGAEHLSCNVIEDNGGDSNNIQHVIHGENLVEFRKILAEFLEEHRIQFTKYGMGETQPNVFSVPRNELIYLFCDIFEGEAAYSVISYTRLLLTNELILETTNCGADMADVLSIDLNGKVRTCPHAGEKHIYGDLNNIKGIRILSLDMNRSKSHCNACMSKKVCRSSCPINLPDETFLLNCGVEKVWYGELQKAAFNFIFNDRVI